MTGKRLHLFLIKYCPIHWLHAWTDITIYSKVCLKLFWTKSGKRFVLRTVKLIIIIHFSKIIIISCYKCAERWWIILCVCVWVWKYTLLVSFSSYLNLIGNELSCDVWNLDTDNWIRSHQTDITLYVIYPTN